VSSKRKRQTRRQWRRVDLHLHTPASSDYQVTGVSNLDILRAAVTRKLMAGCSLAIWIGVIFFGRFLPYLGME